MDYSRKQRTARSVLAVGLVLSAVGCRPEGQPGQRVESAADLYRQGRAIEDRVAGSDAEARANLQQARTVYIRALSAKPDARTEAFIRAGLGNVSFYQDDYQTAMQQWQLAYPRLDDANLRSMTLLRMGMAQQRQGRFAEADRTFLQLQQQFPQSPAAQVSRTKYGARSFWVQLAVFSQPALADKAIVELRKGGFNPSRLADNQGRQIIRVGPVNTYAEAVALKNRAAGTYPGAIISP